MSKATVYSNACRSNIPDLNGPKYEYCICKCGNRAMLRIVTDAQKPTKGLLYFNCAASIKGIWPGLGCDFFAWCLPRDREEASSSTLPVENAPTEVDANGRSTAAELVTGGRSQAVDKVMEDALKKMVYLMVASVVISACACVIHVFK